MAKQFRPVEVSWNDSNVTYGWQDTKPAEDRAEDRPLMCKSVGYVLLKEKDDRIVLVQSIGHNDNSIEGAVAEVLIIPWNAIVEIKELT